jgi:hypothetical protein
VICDGALPHALGYAQEKKFHLTCRTHRIAVVTLNKVAGALLFLGIVTYAASVAVGDPFVYILCFVFLVLAVLFGLLVLATNLAWRLFPSGLKKAYDIERIRFKITIILSVPLAFIVADAINDEYLAGSSSVISMLGNAGVMVFTIFVAWSFIKRSRWRTIFASSGIFVVFIGLLSFVGSAVPKSSEAVSTDSVDKLKSLGYVAWVPAEAEDGSGKIKAGVTVHDPESAFEGLNLYSSSSKTVPEAYLIDMDGNIVNKWVKKAKRGDFWEHVRLCEDGELLVVAFDEMLLRLDWDSNVMWKTNIRVHHDVCVDENKNIYAIAREDKLVFWCGIPVPILADYIAILSPEGKIKRKVYVYDLMKEYFSPHVLVEIYRAVLKPKNLREIFQRRKELGYMCKTDDWFDIMHTNGIEIIDRDIEGFCKRGDWLISIRELNLVAVSDARKDNVVWVWGPGELKGQHHPTLLENGNMLIFDNGVNKEFTRIVELDPLAKEIVWEYKSSPPEEFFSKRRGSCQRLPNGNTLITESDEGRVFEITREGKTVWEFYEPEIRIETKKRKRRAIYRMMRITYPVKL